MVTTDARAVGDGADPAMLLANEEQFRLFVTNVTDCAIYMLSPDGIVTSWNAGGERLKGYRADEIVGQSVSLFFTEEDIAAGAPARELARAAADGRFTHEGRRVRKDGSRSWANVVLSALRDSNGLLTGFAKITRDISARKAAGDALRVYTDHRPHRTGSRGHR